MNRFRLLASLQLWYLGKEERRLIFFIIVGQRCGEQEEIIVAINAGQRKVCIHNWESYVSFYKPSIASSKIDYVLNNHYLFLTCSCATSNSGCTWCLSLPNFASSAVVSASRPACSLFPDNCSDFMDAFPDSICSRS